jgi:hypothetical protein
MKAITIADLTTSVSDSALDHITEGSQRLLTSPHASWNGGTPVQPCGTALRVSYRVENRCDGIRFIPVGQQPPFAAAYVWFVR